MGRRKRSERAAKKKQAISEQRQVLNSPGERQEFFENLGFKQLNTAFKEGFGQKRNDDKPTGRDIDRIYSKRTLSGYKGSWRVFSRWLAQNVSEDDLERLATLRDKEAWIEQVDKYLIYCMKDDRTSAGTQSTYKAGLAKVLGISSTNFIKTKERYRKDRVNNRLKESDDRMSAKSNAFWKKIVGATGLRKNELENITGDALFKNKYGKWYIHIKGKKHGAKGGRERYTPVLAKDNAELREIIELFRAAGKKKVFHVPTALKPHKYRALYAERVYRSAARDTSEIKNKEERIYLRKELKGVVLDRKACDIVTNALGHGRDDEFQKSYAYTLIRR